MRPRTEDTVGGRGPAAGGSRAVARLCWRTDRVRCLLVLLLVGIGVVGQPGLGLLLRNLANAVVEGDQRSALRDALFAAVLWGITHQLHGIRGLLLNDIRALAGLAIDEDVIRLTTRIPGISHLEDPRSLDRINAARGVTVVDRVVAMVETAGSVLGLAATMAVLSSVSGYLILLLPLAFPVLWFERIGRARRRRAQELIAEEQRTADALLETVLDPVTATELRVTGAGPVLLDRYQNRWRRATRLRARARTEYAILMAAGYALSVAGIGCALAVVAWRMRAGEATVGDLVLLLAVARQQQGLVQASAAGLSRIAEAAYAMRSYIWLTELATAGAPSGAYAAVPERLTSGISLSGVSFGYPGTERTVLRDVAVELRPGTVVALVGEHGSGKTSLVKLLTGMYPPSAGSIRLDGRPLTGYDPVRWRNRISCGFQDFVRFQTSVHESVGVGDLPRIDDLDRIRQAVRHGAAEDVVDALDHGLETRLGTLFGGVGLSGGQWQRLALARTCMREAPLLMVLDEPTAALDPRGEYEVYRRQIALARTLAERGGTITLIVSHRFSTVRAADLILVLSAGRIVERGSHTELLAAGGRYARLYGRQRAAYQ
ncbi:ATP-binding cassette, subfamily B [Streptomyces sp. TLI_053]|uniref:ABC transporter ATP-binding protein n=1 Tax=Streptomyces sp. TLI_053 TaxID=1855352 RepID=UPI000879558F|nr:ABC transporter ATP-binding protein [Streptomyces sp. TLI_053]SDT83342.1 ATP-binding cassette, subfamily B [Streptomyces sp. TLI_053]